MKNSTARAKKEDHKKSRADYCDLCDFSDLADANAVDYFYLPAFTDAILHASPSFFTDRVLLEQLREGI